MCSSNKALCSSYACIQCWNFTRLYPEMSLTLVCQIAEQNKFYVKLHEFCSILLLFPIQLALVLDFQNSSDKLKWCLWFASLNLFVILSATLIIQMFSFSISALQWLCNADKKTHNPPKRLYKFFSTLYGALVSTRYFYMLWYMM